MQPVGRGHREGDADGQADHIGEQARDNGHDERVDSALGQKPAVFGKELG